VRRCSSHPHASNQSPLHYTTLPNGAHLLKGRHTILWYNKGGFWTSWDYWVSYSHWQRHIRVHIPIILLSFSLLPLKMFNPLSLLRADTNSLYLQAMKLRYVGLMLSPFLIIYLDLSSTWQGVEVWMDIEEMYVRVRMEYVFKIC
jgi:hypothetical protein